MQPKAAKKIGGMTPKKIGGMAPKKMTGGDYGEPETITLGSDYIVTKQIDKESGMMKICVASEMPGAVKEEDKYGAVPPSSLEDQAAGIGAQFFENGVIPVGENLTQEVVNAAKAKKEEAAKAKKEAAVDENTGGKKKRKPSKKRRSMKKKGGMKRKSMKVKA